MLSNTQVSIAANKEIFFIISAFTAGTLLVFFMLLCVYILLLRWHKDAVPIHYAETFQAF